MHLLAQYFQVLAFTLAIRYTATSSAIMSLQQFAQANNVSADFCSALAMMEAPMVHDDAVIIKVAKTFKVFSHCMCPCAWHVFALTFIAQENGIEDMCSLIGIVDADLEMDEKGLNAAMKGMMRRAVSKANERFVSCSL